MGVLLDSFLCIWEGFRDLRRGMYSINYDEYLASSCIFARDAGRLIMTYFEGVINARNKEDNSPVTDADIAANALIVNALRGMAPHIPIVAEEDDVLAEGGYETFWLVDPLDGTRSFVRGEPEFTVNIGLIHQHKPVMGVIFVPATGILYHGQVGKGAFREGGQGQSIPIAVRTPAEDGMVVVKSRSHPSVKTTAFLETVKVKQMIAGSSSVKFCQVAEGSADIYPRFGRTMEWDTAAGHAILEAAGGRVTTAEGEPFLYGKAGYENPPFIAYGY